MKRLCAMAAFLPIVFLTTLGAQTAETPQKHIRVVVDTSGSLHHTDPSGYVKLSAELFYDLAVKEFYANDTFAVAHFPDHGDPGWRKSKEPPQTIDVRRYVDNEQKHDAPAVSAFRLKIRNLPYTSDYTYFSPCFQWALDDLKTVGTPRDNRVIVLITDGISDAQDADAERLSRMADTLRQNNIRVFVLAFGDASQDWFSRALRIGQSGVQGAVFGGVDSKHLLFDMVEIFSRSFGFSKDPVAADSSTIDVAHDRTLQSAAVIALYTKPRKPEFKLTPPSGHAVGADRVNTEAAVRDSSPHADVAKATDVSYAYEWLTSPEKGTYRFESNGVRPDEIVVLRPVRVRSTIGVYQGNPTDVVMAGKPAPMEVLVSQLDGSTGDPGQDIRIKYNLRYFKPDDGGRDANDYAPSPESGTPTSEGRVFLIQPDFAKDPSGTEPGKPYQGYIDVEVSQFDSPVARMSKMHPVTVYPYLSVGVIPNPVQVLSSSGKEEIEGGQAGCASEIKFVDNSQSLTADRYTLSVRLLNPPESSGAWNGAKFQFDGIEFSGIGAATEMLSPEDLGKPKHRFCVIAGTPSRADPDRQLQVHFGLWRNGADANEQKLNIVDDMDAKVNIAAPDFWHMFKPWLLLLLTALLMYLLILLLRSKYGLAPDLGVVLGAGSGGAAGGGPRGEGFGWGWLGLPQDMPVLSLDGAREVGRVKPKRDGLYVFRPGPGFQNVCRQSKDAWGEWLPIEPESDGSFRLAAGVTYRAGTSDAHLFRVEYSHQRPGI